MKINGFMTVSQIAADLGLSYHGAYSLARRGKLGASEKIGNTSLYTSSAVARLQKRRKAAV